MQFLIGGQSKQLFIRHRTPQEIREAARQSEVIQLAAFLGTLLVEKKELRRDEHCLQPHAHRLLKGVTSLQPLPHSGDDRLNVLIHHRTAEGTAGELPQDALGIWQRIFGNDLAPVGVILLGHVLLLQIAKKSHMTRWRP